MQPNQENSFTSRKVAFNWVLMCTQCRLFLKKKLSCVMLKLRWAETEVFRAHADVENSCDGNYYGKSGK